MRILVIEDSKKLLDSLRIGLTGCGHDVSIAADGATGLAVAQARSFDVIVLDLLLPELSGIEVLRELRASDDKVQVLLLSALDAVEDRVRGLRAGADDYLVKPFDFDELLARLEALTRRRFDTARNQLEVGPLAIDTHARTVRLGDNDLALTRREYDLLEYLAFRRGEVVSRMDIEEHLYGSRSLPLSNVVDSAICSIRAKLRRLDPAKLIHTRPRQGYVLSSETQ